MSTSLTIIGFILAMARLNPLFIAAQASALRSSVSSAVTAFVSTPLTNPVRRPRPAPLRVPNWSVPSTSPPPLKLRSAARETRCRPWANRSTAVLAKTTTATISLKTTSGKPVARMARPVTTEKKVPPVSMARPVAADKKVSIRKARPFVADKKITVKKTAPKPASAKTSAGKVASSVTTRKTRASKARTGKTRGVGEKRSIARVPIPRFVRQRWTDSDSRLPLSLYRTKARAAAAVAFTRLANLPAAVNHKFRCLTKVQWADQAEKPRALCEDVEHWGEPVDLNSETAVFDPLYNYPVKKGDVRLDFGPMFRIVKNRHTGEPEYRTLSRQFLHRFAAVRAWIDRTFGEGESPHFFYGNQNFALDTGILRSASVMEKDIWVRSAHRRVFESDLAWLPVLVEEVELRFTFMLDLFESLPTIDMFVNDQYEEGMDGLDLENFPNILTAETLYPRYECTDLFRTLDSKPEYFRLASSYPVKRVTQEGYLWRYVHTYNCQQTFTLKDPFIYSFA
ncbi:hypothetical protein BCR34DRAFT_601693 [Clohesyomyces aquaticus]|uniref:Uncharacterized protein n=1 Tax=Clohesyomyces aquaticus TaxID=1231657 RepID=A0A1Y1ZM69_9PLEO|nr:hypothetical protein BCR34DRAFT_601693 [Clohesyomyces aquaticus]